MPTPPRGAAFIIRPDADLIERYPALRHNASALARAYARKQFVTDETLQAIGRQLWQALAIDDAFAAARQAAGALTLPVIIASRAAALQQLPWETLHHPQHGFLGRANGFTLLRNTDGARPARPAVEHGPLRVLLFTSLPDDLDAENARLDVEEEQAQVLEALNPFVVEGVVVLETPDDGRFSTLQTLLKEFRPHLLFLSGHGKFHHAPHSGAAPYATFLFEGEEGGGDAVHEAAIAEALLGTGVGCVVLSACESGMTASDALSNGLTWRLSQLGIPHVVGMRESVLDRAGTLFIRAFCEAIVRQTPVDEALQAGRRAIITPLKDSPRLGDDASGLAESSLGQWPLPSLISHDPAQPLIDWNFTPHARELLLNQTLNTITLPPRFIGRRAELRTLQSRLRQARLHQLLITGPGGQGKTALAGRLAQLFEQRGLTVFAWSARPENDWQLFQLELELALSTENIERYNRMLDRLPDEEARAVVLLRLLLQQHGGKLVLFFDNLESCQAPGTQQVQDARLAAWIRAAQGLTRQGLILLLTSRWKLPGWPEADHLALGHASYGDFLQMANRLLPLSFLRRRDWLRQVYATLHGNGRGLTFFAAAVQGMTPQQEAQFQQKLEQAATETQTNMALAQIVEQLPAPAATLLQRLPAYRTPIPLEGIVALALELPDPAAHLQRLLMVSLVEPSFAHDLRCEEYQLSPLVADWLSQQGVAAPEPALLACAAEYQHYLFRYERRTLTQAIVAHEALQMAGQRAAADRLALERIVGPLNLQGLYRTLLDDWLPSICESDDAQTRGAALGQTGNQYHHLGDYDTALRYLERSLTIRQEIGDKQGEGTTLNNISALYHARGDYDTALRYLERSLTILQEIGDAAGLCATRFNMGHIYWQHGQQQEALNAWVAVYRLATKINLAQVLQALEGLAGSLGMAGGLQGWAELSRRMAE